MARVERGQTEWEFVPLSARPFITIRINVTTSEDPMTDILDELAQHQVDGAVVRLIITATETQELLLDDKPIRQALRGASYVAAIVHNIERTQYRRLGDVSTEALTPQQVLELYLDSKETPAERKAELLRYAEIIFKGT